MSPERSPERAVVGLGSNLGGRAAHLAAALRALRRTPGVRVLARSRWHETEPVGGPPGQPRYLNGAAVLATTLAPRELLARLQAIERARGRRREAEPRHGPRTLDLDLLFFGQRTIDEPGLCVPHPRLEGRRFVLLPLAELEPERVLASGRTVREQLARLAAAADSRVARAMIELFTEPEAARAWCARARESGRTLGFVPTMGALHDGHLGLVRRAADENALACASVFVNPLQFDDPRDFERYPRDLERDRALLEQAGAALAFTGTLASFFPGRVERATGRLAAAELRDPGPAAEGLEGEQRPGHFAGVATIVARLFAIVRPDRAYFGQKDFQQTLVVRALARELGYPEIVVCPTAREPSGLARSSRNELLSAAERERAAVLHRGLHAARAAWARGERRPAALSRALRAALHMPGVAVEYAEVRDPLAWSARQPERELERAIALVAARVGAVRLIDNLLLDGAGVDGRGR